MAQAARQQRVRPAAVAGTFYPADRGRLQSTVTDLLDKASPAKATPVKALIAPHAGYIYSGGVAATAFAPLRDEAQAITRVVLIGPAHYVAVRGIAAPTVDAFATPLGPVAIARDALTGVAALPFVVANDIPHAPEHALEVELPLLQGLVPAFELVPLLAGAATPQQVAELLDRLWGGPETLIVVSSDLSHYHDYATAQQLDAATAARIESADWGAIRPEDACGHVAVAGLLKEASRRRLKIQRLALCNSGDTAGSRRSVVGYGAWAFSERE